MSLRSSHQTSPASHVRINARVASWFLASLVLASLGLIFARIIVDPASSPSKETITYQEVIPD